MQASRDIYMRAWEEGHRRRYSMKTEKIKIPYNFIPRDYQVYLFWVMRHAGKTKEEALRDENKLRREDKLPPLTELPADQLINRGILTWHRRAGKDLACLNFMIMKMYERVGVYFYCYPEQKQGKKAIWDNIDNDKRRYLDYFPPSLVKNINNTELKLTMSNGSIFQLIGVENIQNVRSTNPVGLVMAEFAYQDPKGWDTLAPILGANNGWVIFNSTPNGKNNHYFYDQWAREHRQRWFHSFLTVKDTGGILSKEFLEEERERYLKRDGDDSEFQREYYCSFEISSKGSYYGHILEQMEKDGRFMELTPGNVQVDTWWDIGYGDATAIWFTQSIGQQIRVLDYYENSGEGMKHYIKVLQEKREKLGYIYRQHWGPHDLNQGEMGTGRTKLETARSLGINFRFVPDITKQDGIEAVRSILPQCVFDKKKCARGLEVLRNYCKEWDEKGKCFRNEPRKHHWTNHGCLHGDTLIDTRSGRKKIKDIVMGEFVRTPFGYRRVLNCGITGYTSELLNINTGNNNLLVTKNHLVYKGLSLDYSDTFRYNDVVINNNKLWTWRIIRELLDLKGMNLSWRKVIIDEQALKHCTKQFGRNAMARYLKGILFIILTIIPLIMTYLIYKLCQKKNTCDCMVENKRGMDQRKTLNSWKGQEQKQMNGMDQRKEKNSIQHLVNSHGSIGRNLLINAWFAVKNIKHHIQHGLYFVLMRARENVGGWTVRIYQGVFVLFVTGLLNATNILRQERVIKVVPLHYSRKQPVYDLTVEEDHCYFANNILVSNSDSFRYLAVGVKLPNQNKRLRKAMDSKLLQRILGHY